MVPSLSAFVVYSLLEKHCGTYVDPGFTASMEERLDQIARGEEGAERVAYLDEFYAGDSGLAAKVKHIDETVSADEARRATLPSMFLNNTNDADEIGLFVGPWGPYVQKISVSKNDTESPEKPPTVNLPAGMATVSAGISRDDVTNSYGGLNEVSTVRFKFDQNITSLWRYNIGARYEKIDAVSFAAATTNRDTVFFEPQLFYTIDRHWRASASYRYVQRKFTSDTSIQ